MRDFPGPGIEPLSLALAGGSFTTDPPGKLILLLIFENHNSCSILPHPASVLPTMVPQRFLGPEHLVSLAMHLFIEVELIYNITLVSGVYHSVSTVL